MRVLAHLPNRYPDGTDGNPSRIHVMGTRQAIGELGRGEKAVGHEPPQLQGPARPDLKHPDDRRHLTDCDIEQLAQTLLEAVDE
jgi:hypothetical protein